MANFFKDEINQFGDRLEKAIEKAGDEISTQRSLTKQDVEELIRFAANEFGRTLDERIEKARQETSDLVVSKISLVREQLSDAAAEQKRVALRNATVAVGASLVVGIISIYYKKFVHGDMDLIDVFRSVMLAFASGYFALLCFKGFQRFFLSANVVKNVFIVGLGYFDVLKPRGTWKHIAIFFLIVAAWSALNYGPQLQQIFLTK